jgi:ubiquinone/menaquinone biosynthesis C-methylase UbiE
VATQLEELRQIHEKTRKSYNLAAEKYFADFKDEMKQKEYDRAFLDKFSKHFSPESILCDVGCGPGHITRYIHDKWLNIFGVDISEKCVEVARRENPRMRFQVMDMADLDLADESVDGIISFYSIIHTPKRFQPVLFREFNRILKIGGRICVVVKKGDTEGYVEELIGFKTSLYFANFNEEEIRNYLEANKFRGVSLETRHPYYFEIPVDRIYATGVKVAGAIDSC